MRVGMRYYIFLLTLVFLPFTTSFSKPFTGNAIDLDPEMIVGPKKCKDCHMREVLSWKKLEHYSSWKKMHRTAEGREIARNLSIGKSIKRSPECIKCHYTPKVKG